MSKHIEDAQSLATQAGRGLGPANSAGQAAIAHGLVACAIELARIADALEHISFPNEAPVVGVGDFRDSSND